MSAPPSRWPRMLDRQNAAEYCGVSVNHFLQHCPVQPFEGFVGRKLWDRKAIDEWLDGPEKRGDTPTIEELLARA